MGQNSPMRADVSGARLSVVSVVILGLFAALFSRLWFLQVAASPGLEQTVVANLERTIILPPTRGRILDTTGRILADNKPSLSVVVDQNQLRDKLKRAALFERLSGALQTPTANLEERYQSVLYERLLPLPVADDVTEATGLFIKERSEDYVGVDVIETSRREYRFAPLASHIVGYVGKIQAGAWPTLKTQGYRISDLTGSAGIEKSYEKELRGKAGYRKVEIDASNRPVRVIDEVLPEPGLDVLLTLDLKVQQFAEQALAVQLAKRQLERPPRPINLTNGQPFGDPKPLFPATIGSVVVIDAQNGAVVAMASNPTFDPRWYDGTTSPAKLDSLFGNEKGPDGSDKKGVDGRPVARFDGPLFNRAISGQYAIGSTMKLFTATAAMRYGVVDPQAIYEDVGVWTFPEGFCRNEEPGSCKRKNAGNAKYGEVTLADALMVSSDAYFYELGSNLYNGTEKGTDPLQTELRNFGFGSSTKVGIPGEQPGLIPDASIKKALADRGVIKAIEGRDFYLGDSVNMAIGQGLIGVTPLQLANGYATFANGGTHRQPRIVRALVEPAAPDKEPGRVDLDKLIAVKLLDPVILHQNELPPYIALPVLDGLRRVVSTDRHNGKSGTAQDAFLGYNQLKFPVWGKTGTAQTDNLRDERDTALFASFGGPDGAPPRYGMAAILEDSGFGGQAAAPLSRCIWEALADPSIMLEPRQSEPLDRTQTAPAFRVSTRGLDLSCLDIDFSEKAAVGNE